MKLAVLLAVLGASTAAAQTPQSGRASAPPVVQPDRIAEAYDQFLRAHRLEDDDVDGAITAYRRALTLDPGGADIAADLANLYMRENRPAEAIAAAEQAVKIAPLNREANRVLGTIYAAMASGTPDSPRPTRTVQQQNVDKAIQYLEKAIEPPMAAADANLRAMLSRLYVAANQYDKAIPILTDLVKQEPGWQDGPGLLVEAYAAAGRSGDAVAWLEEAAPENPQLYGTLADFYGRDRRWADSATAYEQAIRRLPRSVDLRVRLARSLLNTGRREDVTRARDVLREALGLRATDEAALFLLSQAERRGRDYGAAETAARRLMSQNSKDPRGYYALAETLEEQRKFQPVVDALAPAITTFRGAPDGAFALSMLLPHIGFAYQELGQYDKAIATFEEAKKLAPDDQAVTGYLIQTQLAAKNYLKAAELAHSARTQNPGDLRLAQFEAQALVRGGKVDQGLAVLEDIVQKQADQPAAYIALAQGYADANRGAQAVKLMQDAQTRFPSHTGITFELGVVLDRQKKYVESEAVFRQLIGKEPENAAALNYLGYLLAERGERLDESVQLLKRALTIDPENGSYLDSLGWAYYKDGQLNLAFENLKRAADQLATNSVVQDHYGDLLLKMGRADEAIAAWTRALGGDGDSIDRGDIDKKIRSARQKLPKR